MLLQYHHNQKDFGNLVSVRFSGVVPCIGYLVDHGGPDKIDRLERA